MLGNDILTNPDSILPADLDFRSNLESDPVTTILVMLLPDNFISSTPVEDSFLTVLEEVHNVFDTVFAIGRKKEDRSRRFVIFLMCYAHVRKETPTNPPKWYGCLGGFIICEHIYVGRDPHSPSPRCSM